MSSCCRGNMHNETQRNQSALDSGISERTKWVVLLQTCEKVSVRILFVVASKKRSMTVLFPVVEIATALTPGRQKKKGVFHG